VNPQARSNIGDIIVGCLATGQDFRHRGCRKRTYGDAANPLRDPCHYLSCSKAVVAARVRHDEQCRALEQSAKSTTGVTDVVREVSYPMGTRPAGEDRILEEMAANIIMLNTFANHW
jgi:hypothetical protein